jgi:hypothetical protein
MPGGVLSMGVSGHFSKSRLRRDGEQWRGGRKTSFNLRQLMSRSRSEEGQSLLEFALTATLFFLLLFALFDFGHLFFVEMDVQNALQQAARYGSTGNHLPDPKNPRHTLSRVDSIISTLQTDAMGVKLTDIEVSSLNGGARSAGGPGDMLTVSATAKMSLVTPLVAQMFPKGNFSFTESITVRNEPFPPSQTK